MQRYAVGNIVRMKKKHPCGSDLWQIMRTGVDFGLKCQGCGRFVQIGREKFLRLVRGVVEE
ncbi:DUF951 domain-containing protein [Selenomonas sputigena]|uniref:DUF951 domain-containing protein n=1 Tax=Selenomonas sputigena TaxID=69823 RepID=A0ABV3X804_9FIRM